MFIVAATAGVRHTRDRQHPAVRTAAEICAAASTRELLVAHNLQVHEMW
jgi:hypothetical protein